MYDNNICIFVFFEKCCIFVVVKFNVFPFVIDVF